MFKPKPVPPTRRPRQATAAIDPVTAPVKEMERPAVKTRSIEKHNIPFEVDFGDGRVETNREGVASATSELPVGTAKTPTPSFEFAFDNEGGSDARIAVEQPKVGAIKQAFNKREKVEKSLPDTSSSSSAEARKTKHCPDCVAELPTMARFCYACGYPQPEESPVPLVGEQAPEEDFLVLEELPDEGLAPKAPSQDAAEVFLGVKEEDASENSSLAEPKAGPVPTDQDQPAISTTDRSKTKAKTVAQSYSSSELRQLFREHFQETIITYFGERKLKAYFDKLGSDIAFQQLRDGSLSNLLRWLKEAQSEAAAALRIHDTLADLTEYFIVESAGDLSGNVLPQRLLRHQSVDWDTVDLFKLVMDYLDFERESERVYTDFVTMPERSLRNATRSFLKAGKDERVFLICDQSLISQAKNGFAVTDSGLYWKTVLQPAGVVLFKTLSRMKLEQGHLKLDGQFFNAGASLNLKLALLLRKLGRM